MSKKKKPKKEREESLHLLEHHGARVSIDMNAFQKFADSVKSLPPNTFGPAW